MSLHNFIPSRAALVPSRARKEAEAFILSRDCKGVVPEIN